MGEWLSLKVLVTPWVLRIAFHVLFWLGNLLLGCWLLFTDFVLVLGAVRVPAVQVPAELGPVAGYIFGFVFINLIWLVCILLYNLFLRVGVESVIVLFNIHDYLKILADKSRM
jgi:hypothetical protein